MLPPESAFCSNHDRKRTFLGVLNQRFETTFIRKISMDATAFCSNHVWKRWFWPQKLSMNAPRFESAFWNAVYSKSAFWNAVYSKISMDATAFCSNHVWKRWFWPQKLSINAPLDLWSIQLDLSTTYVPSSFSLWKVRKGSDFPKMSFLSKPSPWKDIVIASWKNEICPKSWNS